MPEFAHDELEVFIDKLNVGRKPKITAPDMLGALMVAVQQLPHEVAAALLPAYEKREKEILSAADESEATS